MTTYDCVVIGAGPAGTALSWLLARSGMQVMLVDDGKRPGGAPRETLLGGSRRGLLQTGLLDLVARCATIDARRHGAIWGRELLVFRDDEAPGLVLQRGPFDAALREAAAEAGALVRGHTRVVGPLPESGRGEVSLLHADGCRESVQAERIVLATGRRARADLLAVTTVQRGPETISLSLVGRCAPAANLAIVESVPSGWWWWIGDGRQGGSATLLCDADEVTIVGTRTLLERARQEAFGPVHELCESRLAHVTWATARLATAASDVLLLGDAAATIDPLASQGVEKALAAADHAAAAIRTAREHPDWWGRLCRHHAQWERGLYDAHAATTAAFLQQETRFAGAPFWAARSAGDANAASREPRTTEPGTLEVFVSAPGIVETAVLDRFGDRFREVAGATQDDRGVALAQIGYVPVVPLLRVFATPRTLAAGIEAAGRDARLFVLPREAIASAMRELVARGWLTPLCKPPLSPLPGAAGTR